MNTEALKELLFKIADDALILGHRNSEWTGIGPTLEEDIAFSSMAQDKIGQAFQLYTLLQEHTGEADPDTLGFGRNEKDYKCCHFTELPTKDYAFALVRHFLFDSADELRYQALRQSSFQPLAALATKVSTEVKYHTMHADVWMELLSKGNELSKARLQAALDQAMPYALGVFEESTFEQELIEQGIFVGEKAIEAKWKEIVKTTVEKVGLKIEDWSAYQAQLGGRSGYHTEFLKPLLDEMTEVYQMNPSADW